MVGDPLAEFAEGNYRYGPAIVDSLNRLIGPALRLTAPIKLHVAACDKPFDESYDPTKRLITLCSESLDWAIEHDLYGPELADKWPLFDNLTKTHTGTFLAAHELAHATLFDLRVPIVGDEETMVDELAAVLLMTSVTGAGEGANAVSDGVWLLLKIGELTDSGGPSKHITAPLGSDRRGSTAAILGLMTLKAVTMISLCVKFWVAMNGYASAATPRACSLRGGSYSAGL